MCGIMGYVGGQPAYRILVEGLRSLEYRGYDSAGIVTLDRELHVRKFLGPISSPSFGDTDALPGTMGIAHTRWATHGPVTLGNAHPHLDCSGAIAVVHNGIVENAQKLRDLLSSRGHEFRSDTDTEVIPHLIEENLRRGRSLREAVMETSRNLRGPFAFLALSSLDSGHIYASKNHLPLVVGFHDGDCLASSDPSPLATNVNVIFLRDGELAVLGNGSARIFDCSTGLPSPHTPERVASFPRDDGKGGYDHYMEKEINEQPKILAAMTRRGQSWLNAFAKELADARKIFLIGSGTSYHACLAASYFLNDIARIPSTPMYPQVFSRFSGCADQDDLIIAVSQSGETADILDCLPQVHRQHVPVLAVVNNPASTLARRSKAYLCIGAGLEKGVAATKTYTAQLAAFYLLSHRVAGRLGSGGAALSNLGESLGKNMLGLAKKTKALAGSLHRSPLMILIGRDVAFPTALEAALKIREISYVPSLGLEGAELKHGSLALISEDVPCLVFAPEGDQAILANAEEARARGARLIGIGGSEHFNLFDDQILVPRSEELFPISAIIPMQMLSYHMALLHGNDPDRPRNLAKCVTVR